MSLVRLNAEYRPETQAGRLVARGAAGYNCYIHLILF